MVFVILNIIDGPPLPTPMGNFRCFDYLKGLVGPGELPQKSVQVWHMINVNKHYLKYPCKLVSRNTYRQQKTLVIFYPTFYSNVLLVSWKAELLLGSWRMRGWKKFSQEYSLQQKMNRSSTFDNINFFINNLNGIVRGILGNIGWRVEMEYIGFLCHKIYLCISFKYQNPEGA